MRADQQGEKGSVKLLTRKEAKKQVKRFERKIPVIGQGLARHPKIRLKQSPPKQALPNKQRTSIG